MIYDPFFILLLVLNSSSFSLLMFPSLILSFYNFPHRGIAVPSPGHRGKIPPTVTEVWTSLYHAFCMLYIHKVLAHDFVYLLRLRRCFNHYIFFFLLFLDSYIDFLHLILARRPGSENIVTFSLRITFYHSRDSFSSSKNNASSKINIKRDLWNVITFVDCKE